MNGMSYSRAFSKEFSLGLTAKFVKSSFGGGYYSGSVFVVDFGAHYKKKMALGNRGSFTWQVGLAANNIGKKFCYNCDSPNDATNIPTVLRIGGMGSCGIPIRNNVMTLTWAYQADKLLVPTPVFEDENQNNIFDFNEKSALQGIFSSFGDAPGGADEEWAEVTHKIGTEEKFYFKNIDLSLSLRSGYWTLSESKGGRRVGSLGASINWKGVEISYARTTLRRFSNLRTNTFGLSYLRKL